MSRAKKTEQRGKERRRTFVVIFIRVKGFYERTFVEVDVSPRTEVEEI